MPIGRNGIWGGAPGPGYGSRDGCLMGSLKGCLCGLIMAGVALLIVVLSNGKQVALLEWLGDLLPKSWSTCYESPVPDGISPGGAHEQATDRRPNPAPPQGSQPRPGQEPDW